MTSQQSQFSSSNEKLSISELKNQNNLLFTQIKDAEKKLPFNQILRNTLLHDINSFIAKITSLPLQEKKKHYHWIEKSASEWQGIFSEVFTIPRNIYEEIKLPEKPIEVISSRERQVIKYSQIRKDIATHAYYLGQDRKVSSFEQKVAELKQDRDRIYREFPSTRQEEKQDWHKARTYFAANVLTGKPDLAYQLGEESYEELEQVYLEDAKKLQAYHIWLKNKNNLPLEQNYLKVCEQIRLRLLNRTIKAPEADFSDIHSYLSRRYLNGQKTGFPTTSYDSETTYQLKQIKALRISEYQWEQKLPSSPEEDWKKATEFAVLYYDNIIGAVEGDLTCVKNVLKSFLEPWRSYKIVNCFEAAIALSYIKPELIQKCCNNGLNENDLI